MIVLLSFPHLIHSVLKNPEKSSDADSVDNDAGFPQISVFFYQNPLYFKDLSL